MRFLRTMLSALGVAFSALAIATDSTAAAALPDSSALYGTWRWIGSSGGFGPVPAGFRPASVGYDRFLTIHPRGRYEYFEVDSIATYRLCEGQVTIHRAPPLNKEGPRQRFWMTFKNWYFDLLGEGQIFWFEGSTAETLVAYPGGPGIFVDDASDTWYSRSEASSVNRRSIIERPRRSHSIPPPESQPDRPGRDPSRSIPVDPR